MKAIREMISHEAKIEVPVQTLMELQEMQVNFLRVIDYLKSKKSSYAKHSEILEMLGEEVGEVDE